MKQCCIQKKSKKSHRLNIVFDGVLLLRLQKIYKHPDDVDLFPGLLSETRLPGAVTGPTLSCLIGLQFSHIRHADTISYSKNKKK
jgi:peroxidase